MEYAEIAWKPPCELSNSGLGAGPFLRIFSPEKGALEFLLNNRNISIFLMNGAIVTLVKKPVKSYGQFLQTATWVNRPAEFHDGFINPAP
jgi:hypothetical protein